MENENDRLHLSPLRWWVWWHPFLSMIISMVTSLPANNHSVGDVTSCWWSFCQWDLRPPLTIIQVVSILPTVNPHTVGDFSSLTNALSIGCNLHQVPTDKTYWWWFLPSIDE